PGLSQLVTHNVAAGRLRFTTDAAHAVTESDTLFIAVGTPPDEGGSADLQYVLSVAESIGQHMQGYKLVV
ncbi:MAG TPA: UDP-glucose 6-dehydrogenase, partial [Halomonas sp.]|nr:UDP-glucose 6-dehydrogenase [Halomonas sp.]